MTCCAAAWQDATGVAVRAPCRTPWSTAARTTPWPYSKTMRLVIATSTTMEISTADGSTSALFEVEDAEANSAPAKSELIFNKYGNRYFLAKIFDEANPDGSRVPESPYEKKVSQAASEAQQHVPAQHQGQQGK